ncbi:MAG: UDP-N-acetylmuramoyl-L-alanine--D-glutamate ligase [Aquificae bacterium]|nr:UDP-N-acetylmuramoyl-L-alanine--D-glutamate ligase [Aquificota bacterium]
MRFLVWGKGVSGRAAAELLKAKGYRFYWGSDEEEPQLWREVLDEVDAVVLSPGVPPSHPLFTEALKKGKELIGELELGWRFFKGRALAVTGTDGKSTVTRLTYLALKLSGFKVEEGGNAGKPLSAIALEDEASLAVVEVSSFQGKTLTSFRPFGGAFVSFHPDHLDWHPTLTDYLRSKYRIFARQKEDDFVVLNDRVKEVKALPTKARKVLLSEIRLGEWVSYGGVKLFKRSDLRLPGEHNLVNAAIAAVLAFLAGAPPQAVREAVAGFKGLPYRLEFVGYLKGAAVYNDAKSTTPGALLAALKSFPGRVVLIAGGKDKGADFKPLREEVSRRVKAAVLFGEAREKIKRSWHGCTRIKTAETLEEALGKALEELEEGDVLLFSPGCASFDQFRSYAERGERFNELIRRLSPAL